MTPPISDRIHFVGTEIGGEQEGDVLVAGAYDGDETYVMFQRGLTEAVGCSDPPYIEFCDQSMGGFGYIQRCVLTRQTLTIDLNPEGAASLGAPGFDVDLEASLESWIQLRDLLSRIFQGYSHLLEIRGQ